ncbi:hypothetical protein CEXT_38711 [Caerostris extrusa]|uniref:Uncharacterized protein n=1 Tax=Caerostris extrusa TaxID=172846 RepID=A0AAV4Y103_CAEEX|nr:hypothetical protein CEXT_38711 [Caerostris extrusa]
MTEKQPKMSSPSDQSPNFFSVSANTSGELHVSHLKNAASQMAQFGFLKYAPIVGNLGRGQWVALSNGKKRPALVP